jgi:hypothetical protein
MPSLRIEKKEQTAHSNVVFLVFVEDRDLNPPLAFYKRMFVSLK